MPYIWLQIALDRLRGIEPTEVLQALRAARRRPVAASHAGIQVLTVWARTDAGRPLIVVLRPTGGFDYEIIGASAMTAEQVYDFTQWEAQGMTSHDDRLAALADAAADNRLSYHPSDRVELPPPPDAEPKVTVSLRLDVADYQRVKAAAAVAGAKPTALMRDWVLAGLAGAGDDRTVSVSDLLRALAAVPRHDAA